MPLAKKGDPYVTREGQVIIKTDAIPDVNSTSIGPPIAKRITPDHQRSIKELPTDPKTQTALNVVLVYHLMGLTDNEISILVGIDIEQIQYLKDMPAYQETFEILFSQFISTNSSSLQAKIAAFAPAALESMLDLAVKAKNENARMKAAADVMDRSGLHYETLYGRNKDDSSFESLKIVFEDGEDTKNINIEVGKRR